MCVLFVHFILVLSSDLVHPLKWSLETTMNIGSAVYRTA